MRLFITAQARFKLFLHIVASIKWFKCSSLTFSNFIMSYDAHKTLQWPKKSQIIHFIMMSDKKKSKSWC